MTEKEPEEPKEETVKTEKCEQKITGKAMINATKKIIPLASVKLMDDKGKIIKK